MPYYLGKLQWRIGTAPRSRLAVGSPSSTAAAIYSAWIAVPENAALLPYITGYALRRAKSNRVEYIPQELIAKQIDEGPFEVYIKTNLTGKRNQKLAEFSVHWMDAATHKNPWYRRPVYNRAPDDPRPVPIAAVRKQDRENARSVCPICKANAKLKDKRLHSPCKTHQSAYDFKCATKQEGLRKKRLARAEAADARKKQRNESRVLAIHAKVDKRLLARSMNHRLAQPPITPLTLGETDYPLAYKRLCKLIGLERGKQYRGYPLSIDGRVVLQYAA